MWTTENRGHYDRGELLYPSDLTDEEWRLAEPLTPPAKRVPAPRVNQAHASKAMQNSMNSSDRLLGGRL